MRVRINVQLIDAESGGHVWADRYDRDLEDIFLVQDELTRKIVQVLEVALTGSEKARQRARGKVDGEAYDCLIRAKSCLLQFNPAALTEARSMLERALALDPQMAQAYAYLAILGNVEYTNGWNDRTAADLEQFLALARKACEVDPLQAVSHNALAIVLMWLRRLDEAESAARRAMELDPNSSEARGALGNVLHFGGKDAEAIDSLQHALRLDPNFNLWMHALGRALFVGGRYAEAEAMFKRRLIHLPTSDVSRAYLASLYGHTNRLQQARQIWNELMAVNPNYTIQLTLRVLPYRNAAPLEQFVDGLRKAGLAAPESHH